MRLLLVISLSLFWITLPSGARSLDGVSVSSVPSPSDTLLVLPADPLAGERYDGSFDRRTETLAGDPSLVRELRPQNIDGSRAVSRLADGVRELEFTLYFRRNSPSIDLSYLWNASQAEDLRAAFSRPVLPDSVVVYSWASPEGDYGHNVWLSDRRARAARDFFLRIAPAGFDPSRVVLRRQEENWEGLAQAVRRYWDGPCRDGILSVLGDCSLSDGERRARLETLGGGSLYRELVGTLMVPLRSAAVVLRYGGAVGGVAPDAEAFPRLGLLPEAPSGSPARRPAVPCRPLPAEEPLYGARTVVALKTNALYDLATAVNYAVEVPLGKRFSLQFAHYFPWWHTEPDLKYCLQYLTLGGEARWWFAPKPLPGTDRRMLRDVLVGHFVGVYGMWGKMDLQYERSFGMYQCYPVVSAGLVYGFSFPLSRRWNMELSLSVGYARIPYQHYIPSDDWSLLWRDRTKAGDLHYFGPTQVTVSFVRPVVIRYRVR